jgi:hypothetical protein
MLADFEIVANFEVEKRVQFCGAGRVFFRKPDFIAPQQVLVEQIRFMSG